MTNATMKQRIEAAKSDLSLDSLVMQTTGATRLEHNIKCIFHDDSSPSLHVYDNGTWHCFGCKKSGDALDWLGYLRFGNNYDPRQHLTEIIDSLGSLNIQPLATPPRQPAALQTLIDQSLPSRLQARMGQREIAYWEQQGIPEHTLIQFGVGFTGERYSFGWYYRGLLTAVKLRRDEILAPDLEPKYISLKGSRYSQPFNIDQVILRGTPPPVCLIVEDEKSALAAAACGIVAVAAPAGTKWDSWLSLLSRVERVIIVPDNDDAGIIAANKIRQTARRFEVRAAPVGKDLFDYHESLFREYQDRTAIRAIMKGWLDLA